MNESKLRTARAEDLPGIKLVIDAVELFPSEYLDDMFSGETDPRNQQEFWLTYDDHGIQAVAFCAPERMTNGTWNLLLIAVHPDRQGSGIGRLIMSSIESKLAVLGCRVLLVETSGLTEFARTRYFYEQIGYAKEAVIRNYYDAGDDKIVFTKAI